MDTDQETNRQPASPRPPSADAAGQLAELTESLKTQVDVFGRTMEEPDDVWPLLLFLLRPTDGPTILGISERFMHDERTKRRLTEMAVELATDYQAVALAFLSAGWRRARAPRVWLSSEKPGAVHGELLMIQAIHPAGVRTHIAGVRRSENEPPRLSPWIEAGEKLDGVAARFAEALQPVVRANFERCQP